MDDVAAMPGRLADFIRTQRSDIDEIECVAYETMAGGYSRSMARATIRYACGDRTTEEVIVLRGDPPPGHSMIETDRAHEWSVLERLTELDCIPIPTARHFDSTGEHLGTKAIVMDHVDGGSLQSVIEQLDDYGDHPERLARLWGSINTITPEQLPAAVPRPASWDARIDELIGAWRVAEAASVNSDPSWRYFAAWLEANKPPPLPLRLTHGDAQAPNVMIGPDGDYLVVDWEFAAIGDPREDLGWYNIYSAAAGPNLYAVDPEAFLAAYREVTGFDEVAVNQLTVGYFTILSAIKVLGPIGDSINKFARGENGGAMTALQVGSFSFGHENFIDAIDGMEAALQAIAGASA
jgi:aminoglycoside phosphotransferase (APT) family kinase protein